MDVTIVASSVGLFTKFRPLIVMVCRLLEPMTGLGLMLAIEGAGSGATTVNGAGLEDWPSGLVTFTVQESGAVVVLMDICTRLLLT